MLKALHAKEVLEIAKNLVEEEEALNEAISASKEYKPNDRKALVDRVCLVRYNKDKLACQIKPYVEQIEKLKAHNGKKGGN